MKIRLATIEDSDWILTTRNAELIRRSSLDSNPIDPVTHYRWITAVMNDEDRMLWIAEDGEAQIGVIRLDRDQKVVEISIYLHPTFINQGYGSKLIKLATGLTQQYYPGAESILALIKKDNTASIRVFVKAGYTLKYAGAEILEYTLQLVQPSTE